MSTLEDRKLSLKGWGKDDPAPVAYDDVVAACEEGNVQQLQGFIEKIISGKTQDFSTRKILAIILHELSALEISADAREGYLEQSENIFRGIYEDFQNIPPEEANNILYDVAVIAFERKKYNHSRYYLDHLLTKVQKYSIDWADAMCLKGQCFVSETRYSDAMPFYSEAISNYDSDISKSRVHRLRGVAHYFLKEHDAAISDCEVSVRLASGKAPIIQSEALLDISIYKLEKASSASGNIRTTTQEIEDDYLSAIDSVKGAQEILGERRILLRTRVDRHLAVAYAQYGKYLQIVNDRPRSISYIKRAVEAYSMALPDLAERDFTRTASEFKEIYLLFSEYAGYLPACIHLIKNKDEIIEGVLHYATDRYARINDIYIEIKNEIVYKYRMTPRDFIFGILADLPESERDQAIAIVAGMSDHEFSALKHELAMTALRVTGLRGTKEGDQAGYKVPGSEAISPIPRTWDEAKAQVSGLLKWTEVKKAAKRRGEEPDILDHLRNPETGYGKWTSSAPGLPRRYLETIDSYLHREFYRWGREGGKLPPEIFLPTRSDEARRSVDAQSVADAWRVQSLARRLREKGELDSLLARSR